MSADISDDFLKKYINQHIKAIDEIKKDYTFFKKISKEISL